MGTPEPPGSEAVLLERARALANLSLWEIAEHHGWTLPERLVTHKGLLGELMETALGASAGSLAEPDFPHLGIELKTLPLNQSLQPVESTWVSHVPLSNNTGLGWADSGVCRKLRRVLWLPLEADSSIPLPQRRVGLPFLWSPSEEEEAILKADWEELMELVALGRLDQISAHQGEWLQIRPKAANRRALTGATNADGSRAASLPRGFYLRSSCTRLLMQRYYAV